MSTFWVPGTSADIRDASRSSEVYPGCPGAALYVCYLEIGEPLVTTQVVAYLEGLAREGFTIHLLTFEKALPSPGFEQLMLRHLRQRGITWHYLRYHKWPSLPATLYDIIRGALHATRICRRHGIHLLHGRSHVGAAITHLAARRLGRPYIFDLRGLLADEYVDAGRWLQSSTKYRLTKRAEKFLLNNADGLVVLTRVLRRDLVQKPDVVRHGASLETIPCCVDTAAYRLASQLRDRERKRRGWHNRRVLLYVGKLGGWYLVDELARLFAEALKHDRRSFLGVLTQSDSYSLRGALEGAAIPPDAYCLETSAPADTPTIVAAADVGLSLIRSGHSKRSSSPTKVGEYLAAGLPVVSTAGIGDCDTMLADGRLGVVLKSFGSEDVRDALIHLEALLDDPSTGERCRAYAERELSLRGVGIPGYARLYRRLIPHSGHAGR